MRSWFRPVALAEVYAADAGQVASTLGSSVNQGTGSLFGSPIWLTDTGLQARVHLFSGSTLILGWGHDLRSGGNTFYSAISH